MAKLRVHGFSVSIDGYGAGPDQSLNDPVGMGGRALHGWIWGTRAFRKRFSMAGGCSLGLDELVVRDEDDQYGAGIMGRNMFGPVRGPWGDSGWRGWWGEDPPFHYPVFVLSHHQRPPLQMEGGTTFHFVTDGIRAALDRAREAAGDRDVRLSGGVQTIRQYLTARLVDELHLAISPVLLGRGESLFQGLEGAATTYECVLHESSANAIHLWFTRRDTSTKGDL